MKKLLLIAFAGSIVAASSLMAGDWYIGASVASSSTKIDTVGADAIVNSSKLKNGYGIKGGYSFNESNSLELEYVRITKNIDGSRVNYVYKYPMGDIKPFIGGGVGFIKYGEDFNVDGSVYTFDKRATSWNVKAGLVYEVAKHHEVELGYDYMSINNTAQHYVTPSQLVGIDLKNVRIGRLYAEYNYHF